jgi:hypothetical protein
MEKLAIQLIKKTLNIKDFSLLSKFISFSKFESGVGLFQALGLWQ